MIDEWGNEITENKATSLKQKILQNRNMLFFLLSVFVITIILLQVVPMFFSNKKTKTEESNENMPKTTVTPKTIRKLSRVATESAFLNLEAATASLSSQIEKEDLYESTLIFPPLDTKIEIEQK